MRTLSRSKTTTEVGPAEGQPAKRTRPVDLPRNSFGSVWDLVLIRAVFTIICVIAGWHFHPFGLTPSLGALVGLGFAVIVIYFEIRLRRVSLKRLIGAAIGSIIGIVGAYLVHLVLNRTSIPEGSRSFLGIAVLLIMAYVGLVVGANKGDMLNLQALGGLFGSERVGRRMIKILDTSVIIDGRAADICDARFLEGALIVPRFVLRELQLVADSADPLKRQRGRRGLEVLQRIQRLPNVEVEITEDDFPQIADVDMKLIELAKRYDAKIVTNDFNLNKVASLQGIDVLNVNQLANALKPVVLPGEAMRVFVLREGKEYNQGVAYLDDGTMVVVDGARKMINKTIDISVTSVHQTSAGKMIFGRYDERVDQARQQAAGPAEAHSETQPPSEHAPRPLSPESGHS